MARAQYCSVGSGLVSMAQLARSLHFFAIFRYNEVIEFFDHDRLPRTSKLGLNMNNLLSLHT
jgi:hypothetical protein